jgi:hypothetical protein
MKHLSPLTAVILFSAALFGGCVSHTEEVRGLQQQIDSLRAGLNNSYKPGMGELMSNIQLHHSIPPVTDQDFKTAVKQRITN